MARWLVMGLVALMLVGCARRAAELPEDQDQQLRHNLTRALTPEEIAKMGQAEQGGAAGRPERN